MQNICNHNTVTNFASTMSSHIEDIESHQQHQPLLPPILTLHDNEQQHIMKPMKKAIRQTCKSTAKLAARLPTGTALAFQFLSPIVTNVGQCTYKNKVMTSCLMTLCGLSCIVLSFSDTYRDSKGKVRHGIATINGLWVIDGAEKLGDETALKYRIKFIDFVHAFMTLLVFVAVALFDQNAVSCFYPIQSSRARQMLTCLPVGIGMVCSFLFVAFPNTRHGIGFPLSKK